MKPRILSIICAIALLAGACNGHGASSKDQSWEGYGFRMEDHNHHPLSSANPWTVRADAYMIWEGGFNEANFRVCMISVVVRDSDNEVIEGPYPDCSSWSGYIDDDPSPWAVPRTVARTTASYPPGYTREAFESWVEIVILVPMPNVTYTYAEITCEYHDSDGSNPAACPGRDASGN